MQSASTWPRVRPVCFLSVFSSLALPSVALVCHDLKGVWRSSSHTRSKAKLCIPCAVCPPATLTWVVRLSPLRGCPVCEETRIPPSTPPRAGCDLILFSSATHLQPLHECPTTVSTATSQSNDGPTHDRRPLGVGYFGPKLLGGGRNKNHGLSSYQDFICRELCCCHAHNCSGCREYPLN
jgi:hypothetical protein